MLTTEQTEEIASALLSAVSPIFNGQDIAIVFIVVLMIFEGCQDQCTEDMKAVNVQTLRDLADRLEARYATKH